MTMTKFRAVKLLQSCIDYIGDFVEDGILLEVLENIGFTSEEIESFDIDI